MAKIRDHQALSFDVYGTLIDWEPSIVAFFKAWADNNDVTVSDIEILDAFDEARVELQSVRPALAYPEVLRRAYAFVARRWRRPVDANGQDEFSMSVPTWPPFPDTVESLQYLKRHFRLGCVSNIDDRSLRFTMAKLGVDWDFAVTAEAVGAYKPDFPHFVHMVSHCGRLGVAPGRILHVGQSLRADVAPAKKLGLRIAWIDRKGRRMGVTGPSTAEATPDFAFSSLAELVEAHQREL